MFNDKKGVGKRKSYTMKEKWEVIQYAEKYWNRQASRVFNINESCIRHWRKQRDEIFASIYILKKKRLRDLRICVNAKLEQHLVRLVKQRCDLSQVISPRNLRKWAAEAAKDLFNENFKASKDWCQRFIKKYDLSVGQKLPSRFGGNLLKYERLNSAHAESEDSLSDEYTLYVEEVVQADEIGVESSDVPMPKDDLETVIDFDNDLNSVAHSESNTCSPGAISTTTEVEEVGLPEVIASAAKVDSPAESGTGDAEDASKKIIEEEADGPTIAKKVESEPVRNGTVVRKINEGDGESVPVKKTNPEMHLNGVLPSAPDVAVFNSLDSVDRTSTQKIVNDVVSNLFDAVDKSTSLESVKENHCPIKIAKENFNNHSNNRKRISECSDVNGGSTFKSSCDTEIHLVSDVKKRKISDCTLEVNNIPSNGIVSTVEDTQDHPYAVSSFSKSASSTPSQDQSLRANTDCAEKTVVAKKNIARKHTGPVSTSKSVKDVESTILSELTKHEPNLSNGYISHVNVSTKAGGRDQSTNTEEQYKVNLSVDALSSNTLKNIFKSMRKTLTRRQLEEIVLQKVCEVISANGEIGELKKKISELQQTENHRKATCFNLEKQINQLKGVCQVFIEKANSMKKDNRICTPTMITRSVGLQVTMDAHSISRFTGSASQSTMHQVRSTPAKSSTTLTNNERRSASLLAAATAAVQNSIHPSTSNMSTVGRNSPLLDKQSGKGSTSLAPVVDSVIDLTDKEDKGDDLPNTKRATASQLTSQLQNTLKQVQSSGMKQIIIRPITRHPAPVPKQTVFPPPRPGQPPPLLPSKPELNISRNSDGISLSWNMSSIPEGIKITRYQIYAYQETNAPTINDPWKPVGEVNALPLPMECTLTQFYRGYRYHFTVRAVDDKQHTGPFSEPCSIAL